MSAIAGRVLLIPKGTYDSTYTYSAYDLVYYQGSTYVCKKTALNVLPSNTEYWQIMAQGTASASVAGNYYAECDTSASTPAKVITVPATEYFVLQVGDIVNVKFTYTNTATNPTLNINNTGNKSIVYDTSAVTTDNLWAGGEAGRITSFMYDGTNWVWISHDVDTNTLSDLLDTTISSPTNKQGLIFNGTSNKWENKSLVAGDVIFDNTGTDLVSNDVNDSIVEVNNKKTNNSNLAPIEATTTASRSYLVGDYLMLQGEFYKVISVIAIGDTLTVGTNIQSTNVGKELKHGIVELWANSNYGSAFAGQNISINNFNASLYDSIIIVAEAIASEGLSAKWYEIDLNLSNLSSLTIGLRDFTMSTTLIVQHSRIVKNINIVGNTLSLTFEDATQIAKNLTNTNQGTETTNNERMIPVRILGLIHNS